MTFANDAKNGLPLTETTLAEQLKRSPAGYKTFAVSICHILSLSRSRSLALNPSLSKIKAGGIVVRTTVSCRHVSVYFCPLFQDRDAISRGWICITQGPPDLCFKSCFVCFVFEGGVPPPPPPLKHIPHRETPVKEPSFKTKKNRRHKTKVDNSIMFLSAPMQTALSLKL